jgi:urocanate hydratase
VPPESVSPAALTLIAQVHHAYEGLMQSAPKDSEGLGGKLLYAGELDTAGLVLTIAGNISGAATLAASADPQLARQAMRDGVIDFLVNSLDEALRILKNEIRKQKPVAVGISSAPSLVVEEMLERGVLPNLLPPMLPSTPAPSGFEAFIAQGARYIASSSHRDKKLLVWQIPAEYAQHPASFDALLLEHLPAGDHVARRWLQMSPRYLVSQFRRLLSFSCDGQTAVKLIEIFGVPFEP